MLLHGRTQDRARAAAEKLAQETGKDRIRPVAADLADFSQIRDLAGRLEAGHDHIDVLINNAGCWIPERELTANGYEMQFQVNHLAPFLLTDLLLDQLKAAPQGRVITMTSKMHLWGKLDLNDPMFERRPYDAVSAYCQSKLANVLFTKELARRLAGASVTANCVHPGAVQTDICRRGTWRGALFNLFKPFYLTAQEGARTALYLASAPEAAGASGGYYVRYEAASAKPVADNKLLADRLWRLSAELCGL